MPDKYWSLGLSVVLVGTFFWLHLDALAYLVGAGMVAYAFHVKA